MDNAMLQHGNGFGHEIRGAGQLLANTGGMLNQGTIIADGDNTLTIHPNARGFENRGGVLATGAGGIRSANDYRQTAGETLVETLFDATGRELLIEGGLPGGGGTMMDDVLNAAGTVAPGSSPGTLAIGASWQQPAGRPARHP